MAYIYIIPIETEPGDWLAPLETALQQTFSHPTRCVRRSLPLSRAYDASRAQYSSSQLLLQLIEHRPADAVKVLGIAAVDLFVPVLTFVFGEAQLDGPGAIVSMQRLNNKYYGLAEDSRLLTERIIKESIHELGHTWGLLHCRHPGCVLAASTYVEDIDQKSSEPCEACRRQLTAGR